MMMSAAAAIKTGRYTHEKKTRDIQEVKRLQQLQLMQQQEEYSDHLHCHPYATNPLNHDTTMSDADTARISFNEARVKEEMDYMVREAPSSEFNNMTSLMSSDIGSTMDHMIVKITRLHQQQTPHTPEFFDRLPAKENEYVVSII